MTGKLYERERENMTDFDEFVENEASYIKVDLEREILAIIHRGGVVKRRSPTTNQRTYSKC